MKKIFCFALILACGLNAKAAEVDVNTNQAALQMLIGQSLKLNVVEAGQFQGAILPSILGSLLIPVAGGSYSREVTQSCEIRGQQKMKCSLKQVAHFGSTEIIFVANIQTTSVGDIEILGLESEVEVKYSDLP